VLDAAIVLACGNTKRSMVIVQWNRGCCRDKSDYEILASCYCVLSRIEPSLPFQVAIRPSRTDAFQTYSRTATTTDPQPCDIVFLGKQWHESITIMGHSHGVTVVMTLSRSNHSLIILTKLLRH
jgi:hypothetical protein